MSNAAALSASVLAEALVQRLKGKTIGVVAENVPTLDLAGFAKELRERIGQPFRLAVLGGKDKALKATASMEVTYSQTEANTWRNDEEARNGKKLVVLVLGPVSKLRSLQSALPVVTDKDLRTVIRDRAVSWLDDPKRKAFWSFLARNPDIFTVGALLEFGAACMAVAANSNRHDLVDYEAKYLWLLGMLPHPRMLDNEGERKIAKLARTNLDMVGRLRSLSKQDLRTITGTMEEGQEENAATTARSILMYSRSKRREDLEALSFDSVATVLAPRRTKPKNDEDDEQPTVVREKLLGDEAVVEDIIETGGENLDKIADVYSEKEDEDGPAEVKVGNRTLIRKTRTGTSQISSAVNRLITGDRFGGVVQSDVASDYVECLKLLEGGEITVTEFRPENTADQWSVISLVSKAVSIYSPGQDVLGAWKRYVECRAPVLERKEDLVDHPLLALLHDDALLKAVDDLVAAYGGMLDAVAHLRELIRGKSPNAAKNLMSKALSLDVIFLKFATGSVAVAGPTHPFHLWRWSQIAHLLKDNREEFQSLGSDLVAQHVVNPPVGSPHLLLTNFVSEGANNETYIGIGAIGSLPLYGPPDSRTAARFRAEGVKDIAERFIRSSPYAEFGFEVVVVDPPSVADIVEAFTAVNRGRSRTELIPIHIRIFRTREAPVATDEEDAEMEELAAVIRETRGSFEAEPGVLALSQVTEALKARPAHYLVVFEPGDAQSFKVGIDISPTLSPLIVPRHYSYDPMEDQFDVIIVGSATPFGAYYDLFRDLLSLPQGNTIGRRSGASRWIPEIARLGETAMWFSLVDQGIEPTLHIPKTIRLDKRTSGGRDIHTFTSHRDIITRYVEKVLRCGGLVPGPTTEARTLRLMRRLGGDTVPLVVNSASKSGQVLLQQARGLLGVLAVTAWYEREVPEAIVVSLDTEASRAWILGASANDGRRGDLLCLRQANDGLHLDVIEVKAREDAQSVVQASGSAKTGIRLEGDAIGQIDTTIDILTRIIPKEGLSGVDRARREILRDQLYMAVANSEMSADRRDRAIELLAEFFDRGPDAITGRLFVVHVESHQVRQFPSAPLRSGLSSRDHRVEVFELVESEEAEDGYGMEADADAEAEADAEGAPEPVAKANRSRRPAGDAKAAPEPVPDAEQVGEATPAEAVGLPESISVLVGRDPTGHDVTWDTSKNPNFGVLVTGDSGSGKSQTIRAFIHELRKAGYPVLIFDFKNDYAASEFAEPLGLNVYDVVQNGLPFNPLSLLPNERGEVHPIRQCHDFASIVARVEGLKEQQTHRLVEAQRRAYENHGLDPRAKIPFEQVRSEPVFDEVLEILRENDEEVSNTVVYRLQKFSDLGLFPSAPVNYSFEDLIRDGIVLTLNDANNDKLMRILAEILIVKLHALIKRGDQPRKLRRMLVFDEAWQIAKSQRLVDLAREGRAFGVGMLIGTQYPKDMPENLVGCLRTQIYLYNKDLENQKIIVRALCNTTTGQHAQKLLQTVANLGQFQGYLISEQHKQGIRVNVVPHHERS